MRPPINFIVLDVEHRMCDGCNIGNVKCIRMFPGREQPVWVCSGCLFAAKAYLEKPTTALDYLKLLRDELKGEVEDTTVDAFAISYQREMFKRIDQWCKKLDLEVEF